MYSHLQIDVVFSSFLYDAFYLYALVLNQTLEAGQDIFAGNVIFQNTKFQSFRGIASLFSWYKARTRTHHTHICRPADPHSVQNKNFWQCERRPMQQHVKTSFAWVTVAGPLNQNPVVPSSDSRTMTATKTFFFM